MSEAGKAPASCHATHTTVGTVEHKRMLVGVLGFIALFYFAYEEDKQPHS